MNPTSDSIKQIHRYREDVLGKIAADIAFLAVLQTKDEHLLQRGLSDEHVRSDLLLHFKEISENPRFREEMAQVWARWIDINEHNERKIRVLRGHP